MIVAKYITPDMTALDIGCGDGEYTYKISQYCAHIIGYDVSEKLLKKSCGAVSAGKWALCYARFRGS